MIVKKNSHHNVSFSLQSHNSRQNSTAYPSSARGSNNKSKQSNEDSLEDKTSFDHSNRVKLQSEYVPEHQKREQGYQAKESFSFYRYMAKQNQVGMKFKNERERKWHEKFNEYMNNILRMNMVMLNDKLRAFKTEGFNYKDRKISKAGKIWVKESDKSTVQDYEQEERKLFLKAQIRNGILCKDIKMLKQAIENAHKYHRVIWM